MTGTDKRRRRRAILSERLGSYYEALLEAAHRDLPERWERLIEEAAGDH